MTASIAKPGYHVSDFEIMSLVPSATTMAVVVLVILLAMIFAPTVAFRPSRASRTTFVQMLVACAFTASLPK
jgi:hypothetical protein